MDSLRSNPEIALFLVLALGYALGDLKIGNFKLGAVMGVLIAGIVVGQADIPVSESLKNTFFMLFLFAIGYRTGPQFFLGLRSSGLKQIILAVLVGAVATALSFGISRVMGFDGGQAAGLLAGAMTGSSALGAANGVIKRLHTSDAQRQLQLAHSGISFAVCYLVGTVFVIWLLTKLGPRLMHVDLAQACGELEQEMGLPQEGPETTAVNAPFVTRAYTVPEQLEDKPILELETAFHGYRVFVERLRRDGQVTTPTADVRLHSGDHVAMWGRRQAFLVADNPLRPHEVLDDELLDLGIISRDVVVTRDKAGRTIGELAGSEASRGVFLDKFVRVDKELPYTLQTPIEVGDVLSVTGDAARIDRVAEELGYIRQHTDATNMTLVSTAIFLGALLGLPALILRGIEVTLTLFVGVLIGGLLLGWLSSRHPRLGCIPEPALWLFDSLGLAGFLALVGLQAGPGFVRGWKESGLILVGSAVIVVTVTNLVGILIGRYVLRMHPGLVLGACAGAGTSAPALGAILETAHSQIPALSYGVGYALGNVILAFGGALIVTLIGP